MIELNAKFALRDKGVSNALAVDLLPRHRWYFAKEGFAPALVEHAIKSQQLKPGDRLLDPFSGSGTTALTGAAAEMRVEAFELNPFLWFASRTKFATPRARRLAGAAERVLKATRSPIVSPLEGFSTFSAGNQWDRWLFPLPILRAFEAARQVAQREGRGIDSILKLALIGAAMDCCNAVRDGKCLRYRRDWRDQQASVESFRSSIKARVEQMTEDLEAFPLSGASARIWKGDARKLVARTGDKFQLCVTSPPYLNSFDYSDVYRPELFLGGFVDTNEKLMNVRLRTIRSHLQANWKAPTNDKFGPLYHDCMRRLQDATQQMWNQRLPEMVQAYFEDLEIVLRGLRKRAANDASLWLVVSTSAYGGVEVPVDLIIAQIGQQSGWFLREVGVLRYLRSASQHVRHVTDISRKSVPLRESVIIFDATA